MSDIFISYARSTAVQAGRIAEALRALGYGVWRDDELPAHRAYAEVIEERLKFAKAVVVIWSAEAVRSQWVRAEANVAREAGTLVQLRLDGATPPLPFNEIQCADMADWSGDLEAQGWRKVMASVETLVGANPAAAVAPAPSPDRSSGKLSVCVLPFANMSGDAEQEYFSDGISEDIITDLSKVSALSVVSRNSAFQFKGRHVDVRQVGRQLGVSHVLEGSVRKAGARVRITAQLIEAGSDSHIWAERFDRDLTDIFALQDEISQAIVAALRLRLLPAEKTAITRRGTSSADAYNLFLMARQLWASGNSDQRGLGTILRLCDRATEIDASYAQAWALTSLTQGALFFRYGAGGEDGLAAAERALALDGDLAEAHIVRARYLNLRDRQADAEAEIETALGLDPASYEVNVGAAFIRFRQARMNEAAMFYEAAASAMETSFSAPAMLLTCYAALDDREGLERAARLTLARVEAALANDPGNGQALGFGASALAVLGDGDRAREWIARALVVDPDNRAMRYNLVCALSGHLGDVEGAMGMLRPYLATASRSELEHLEIDPDLGPVLADPRGRALFEAAATRLAETT
ncbi:MAG TPA: TIR domain-containing protein [Caulobacteraceae bacterium]